MKFDAVSIIEELEALRIDFEPVGDDGYKLRCPAHDDKTASASLNAKTGLWKCHACGAKGDFVTFFAASTKVTRSVAVEELAKRYPTSGEMTIAPEVPLRFHEARIPESLMTPLRERCIDEEAIERFQLGYEKGRVTIPVYDERGNCVNIRKYLPGADPGKKMYNVRGCGKGGHIYPIGQMQFETVVLCGGEMKAIAVAMRLNERGVGAVCVTSGESNWNAKHNESFRGKTVVICYDVDPTGRIGARKVASALQRHAAEIRILDLPLDTDLYPKGDINDYFASGCSGSDFAALVDAAPVWIPETLQRPAALGDVDFGAIKIDQVYDATLVGRPVQFGGYVAAVAESAHFVPSRVKVDCDRDYKDCAVCPIYHGGSDVPTIEIDLTSPAVLGMLDVDTVNLNRAIADAAGMPRCPKARFFPQAHTKVETAVVSSPLDLQGASGEKTVQVYVPSDDALRTEVSTTCRFEGRMWPHPRTQAAAFLASKADPIEDALATYRLTDERRASLAALFRVDEPSVDGVHARLNAIYSDLEVNVTRIWKRRPLHLVVDLTYHSPLWLDFQGRKVKGWVETLVLGDSSQGKSETTGALRDHYRLGEKVDSKNASAAGLVGGLQQFGTQWMVSWGHFPRADRRLVWLEELKGMHPSVFARLTDMRSSGMARIEKIEHRRAPARTRLIALSNPRGTLTVSQYAYGVQAIPGLIQAPEDVRRFDLALLVAAEEVNPEEIHRMIREPETVDHRYTSDACRDLVLWAWTTDPAQFTEAALDRLFVHAAAFSRDFTEEIPLVDRGSMRFKLGRLAAALAARVFSSTEDGRAVLVDSYHVDYVARFVRDVYESPVMGYLDYTSVRRAREELTEEAQAKILQAIRATPYPIDLVRGLLALDSIVIEDVMDLLGWDHDEARKFLSLIVRAHGLVRSSEDKRAHYKTGSFIDFLRAINFESIAVPAHLEMTDVDEV